MHRQREVKRHGWLLLISVGAIVLAFMGLSLAITATGTARFAVAMGYRAEVGYVVGGVFDFAKAVLPVALLVLLADAPSFSSPLSDLPASASWPILSRNGCDGEHGKGCHRTQRGLEDGKPEQL